jgi:secondary thiamine-phosphate synthase enzyme
MRVVSRLSSIHRVTPKTIASARLTVETTGVGFFDVTADVEHFLKEVSAHDGALFLFLRHTSASLVIQENASPDVRTDLITALDSLVPSDAGWAHDTEGPDDMPAHVKTMLNGVSLHIPVMAGTMKLGTWQAIYLAEHRSAPHQREIVLQFIGAAA